MQHADPASLNLSGVAAAQGGDIAEAVRLFGLALAIDPDHAPAHCNLAHALLLHGDYARGWKEYEWRLKIGPTAVDASTRATLPPRWTGDQPLHGRTILLLGEQGLGDCLQFCRYVQPLAERGAKVILAVPPPLVALLADLPGLAQILSSPRALPGLDYYSYLMSLPLAFGTTLDDIPCTGAYLRSDAAKVADWERRLGPRDRPRIGLAWSGSPAFQNDANRSIALAGFIRHLPDGFRYVSLQKHVRSADARALEGTQALGHFGDELHDFSDTAALCQCMDVVISVDTSVAHLSAALGKRTWILLPLRATWRWLHDRTDSPWYASARLYRQSQTGDWSGVLQRVHADLSGLLRAHAGGT